MESSGGHARIIGGPSVAVKYIEAPHRVS
jgi:hypothetical protein